LQLSRDTGREMFRRIPIPAKLTRREEPPWLIKGRGIPVTGSDPVTTPILSKAWNAIIAVIPIASRLP